MKRLVWGIIIAVCGVLGLLSVGNSPDESVPSIILGLVCLGDGGVMICRWVQDLSPRGKDGKRDLWMPCKEDKIKAGETGS
jgi:hypothetical protein